jgi:hypothetical protein
LLPSTWLRGAPKTVRRDRLHHSVLLPLAAMTSTIAIGPQHSTISKTSKLADVNQNQVYSVFDGN